VVAGAGRRDAVYERSRVETRVTAVPVEELTFGGCITVIGADEQRGDLVDEVDVPRRSVELVRVHCTPSVPQQELVAEAVSELADDLRVYERLTLERGVFGRTEASDVEALGTVTEPGLGGGEEGTVGAERNVGRVRQGRERVVGRVQPVAHALILAP
jgi:hypothetical protein